jgi:hypothetical protein
MNAIPSHSDFQADFPVRSLPLDETGICDWMAYATPGDALIYYRGHLGHDRMPSTKALPEVMRKKLVGLAARLQQASDEERVHLLQRRHGDDDFSYIAIKSARPRKTRNH